MSESTSPLMFAPGDEAKLRGLLLWLPKAPYHSVGRIPIGSCTVAVLREMAKVHPDWEFAVNWVQDFNASISMVNRSNDRIKCTLRIGGKSNTVWVGRMAASAMESVLRVTTGQQVYDFIREEVERHLEE